MYLNITEKIRKHIGAISATLGFMLWTMFIYGVGEIDGEGFFQGIGQNLAQIGFFTIASTFMQIIIKQGIMEQALTNGNNTKDTTANQTEIKENCGKAFCGYFGDKDK